MKTIINEKGKKAIAEFLKENLAGTVTDETVEVYARMAANRMETYGGLPSIELTMCSSMTGEAEYLELSEDEVTQVEG